MLLVTAAGAAEETSQEFWPEADIWWRFAPAWRVSTFVALSRNIETDYREGSLIAQADAVFGQMKRIPHTRLVDENRAQTMKAIMIRAGLLLGQSLDDHGAAYTERTMLTELHVRMPFKGGVLLSHRLRADLRWLGDAQEFSRRWRYRLQMEKAIDVGRTSIVPYANVEPYYDSRYATVNRLRLISGASVAWSPRTAVEANVTYQHDSHGSATNLFALNVILHVFFETNRGSSLLSTCSTPSVQCTGALTNTENVIPD